MLEKDRAMNQIPKIHPSAQDQSPERKKTKAGHRRSEIIDKRICTVGTLLFSLAMSRSPVKGIVSYEGLKQ
jgi:hypothetical protein